MTVNVLLAMSNGHAGHALHIDTLLGLGYRIHLATSVPASAHEDPRFASVLDTAGLDADGWHEKAGAHARTHAIAFALTFWEFDTVLVGHLNAALGHDWARPDADLVSRHKERQRAFAAEHGLPSVGFAVVDRQGSVHGALPGAGPYIVKAARLSASIGVQLATGPQEVRTAIQDVRDAESTWSSVLRDENGALALIEEFLPGREVTVDGVVVDGRFHLGGIINKAETTGPYFEENDYTMPYRFPDEEPVIVEIAQDVVTALGLVHSLFNIELRQDAHGAFRIVEFSTRISGGQNYLMIRLCHAVDLVRIFCQALESGGPQAFAGQPARDPGRMATCIRFAYRGGRVMVNEVGAAGDSLHLVDYHPMARRGQLLAEPPAAWYGVAGSLAVAVPYTGTASLDTVVDAARALDAQVGVITVRPRGA